MPRWRLALGLTILDGDEAQLEEILTERELTLRSKAMILPVAGSFDSPRPRHISPLFSSRGDRDGNYVEL